MNALRKTVSLILATVSVLLVFIYPAKAGASTTQNPVSGNTYRVRYSVNGKYLDVPSEGIGENGTQLQIWDLVSENLNQIYTFNDTGKGWQIISYQSGKIVEVRDSSHDDHAQVAQWEKHELACGRWDIVSNRDGTISFRNRESQKYLNVSGGGDAANGTKIIQYHDDGTSAMRFYLEEVSTSSSANESTAHKTMTPENGSYVRIRYAANGKYLDVPSEGVSKNGTQIQLWEYVYRNKNQIFRLVDTGNGWQIVSRQSGKIVEVRDSSHDDLAQVAQWDKHNSACARWDIIQNDDGTVSFRNRESKKYLNVQGGGDAGNGTKIVQYHDDGTVAMRFYIEVVGKDDANFTYKTVSLNCSSDIDTWINSVLKVNDNLPGIIVAQEVLSYRSVSIKVPLAGPSYNGSAQYTTKDIMVPYKIRYKLHQHERAYGFGQSWRFENGCIVVMYRCNGCSLIDQDLLVWEIPLPDKKSDWAGQKVISNLPRIK